MAEKPGGITNGKDTNPITETDNRMMRSTEDFAKDLSSWDGPEAETEEIRESIEATRSQMSGTIDAIQEKLSYANISEQVKAGVSEQISEAYESAKNSLYQGTVEKAGKFMKNVGQEIKEINNSIPAGAKSVVPFALIGLGVGLFFLNSRKTASTPEYRFKPSGRSSADFEGTEPSLLSSAQNKVADTASSAYENASEKAGTAYRAVADTAGDAYTKAGELGTKAVDQYRHYSNENPLAIGAAALALGAVVGWAIPGTRYEGEMMGETRDNLLAKAEDTARDAVHKVQEVGEQAAKSFNEGTPGIL